ncbi:response regulator [Kineococcus sp. SYSU DK003]|uniref:response regulator n=1 Tax=Kineococcus sp. SYSU DK003 TaxID=3383124 RepID=UPI003D7CE2F5
MIRVLLADDQALVRAGFRLILEDEPDVEVLEAADGEEAVALTRRERPDLVLMDVRMPGTDGLEATRRITGDPDLAGCRVVILTTFELDEYVFAALRGGASGFLVKDTEPADLLRAVRTVVAGEALLSPSVTRRLIEAFATGPAPSPVAGALAELTGRQLEIVRLVATGASNAEIAAALDITHATARTHVSRILGRLGLRDRAQLVVLAYESGLVAPGRR